ncbi:MAG: ABC transporter permease [Chloroflexi bacterium]|nr:ABC transporter permease [Chloroflexota bacterium]
MTEGARATDGIPESRRKERVPGIPAGWTVIAAKDFADHILSIRFTILLLLLGVIGAYMVYAISGTIRDAAQVASGSPQLFLFLFAGAAEPTEGFAVTFVGFVALLGPLLGIAFGFDAVSAERAEGTLPRLVAQPIHRDDVINGKFVAALSVIVLIFAAVMLFIAGVGLFRLGVTPTGDEALRLATWFLVAVVYVGFWLALAMLASVLFRRAATAALVMISAWIVLVLFWRLIGPVIAGLVAPQRETDTIAQQVGALTTQQNVLRISPSQMFSELSGVLLDPSQTSLGVVLPDERAIPSLLPFVQSLLVGWPLLIALIALTGACFALTYISFMRQEVRA